MPHIVALAFLGGIPPAWIIIGGFLIVLLLAILIYLKTLRPSALLTFGIIFIVVLIGLIYGSEWAVVRPSGEPLPGPIQEVLKIIFGYTPESAFENMLYTYTFFQYLVLPFLAAFIVIYWMIAGMGLLPGRFAAPLAIIIVLITSYTGIFLRVVHGTLRFFGWYAYSMVWIVLIISATAWGVGTIGGKALELERKIRKGVEELAKLQKQYEQLEAEAQQHTKQVTIGIQTGNKELVEAGEKGLKETEEKMKNVEKTTVKKATEIERWGDQLAKTDPEKASILQPKVSYARQTRMKIEQKKKGKMSKRK